MKKKFIRCFSLLLLAIFVFSLGVSAMDINISIERSGDAENIIQKLILTGQVEEFQEDEYVSVKIFNKNSVESALTFDDYKSIGQIPLNSDGTFRYEFAFKEQGDFSIVVNSYNEVKTIEKYISGVSSILELINGLNDGTISATDAVTDVENNRELLFDDTVYKEFDATTKLLIWQHMISEHKPDFSISNIYEAFNYYTILDGVNNAGNYDRVKKIVEYYNDKYLHYDELNVEDIKKTMNATELSSVYDLMRNHSFSNFDMMKGRYIESVILAKYKHMSNFMNIAELLSTAKNEINIVSEIEQYNRLTDAQKKAFCLYLSDEANNVTTISDSENGLKYKVKYALSNIGALVLKYSVPAPETNTGGGGGGGGAGGGNITISDNYLPENKNNEFEYAAKLNDLNSVPWASKEINYLYDKGIINGKAPGEYRPYDNLTRAEMTKLLSVALGVYNGNAESNFVDAKNHWAYRYISSVANKGYILGLNDSEFGADLHITRQDAAVILYRIIQHTAKSEKVTSITKSFSDVDSISDYARNSVLMLSEYGILTGYEDGSFRPKETLNRAQAAVVIYKLLEFINN